jgi:hypothetical protein
MKRLALVLGISVLGFAPVASAEPEQENCAAIKEGSGEFPKHINLSKAWCHLNDAWYKIKDAQKANEFKLGGHAAKAKDLIDQALAELKLARNESNANKSK